LLLIRSAPVSAWLSIGASSEPRKQRAARGQTERVISRSPPHLWRDNPASIAPLGRDYHTTLNNLFQFGVIVLLVQKMAVAGRRSAYSKGLRICAFRVSE
jgi:hypothetical protein